MLSSERVLRRSSLSPRSYLIGDAIRGVTNPIDTRPLTVQEAEERFKSEVKRLKDQHQSALEEAYRNGYADGVGMAGAEASAEITRIATIVDAIGEEFARTRSEWYTAFEQQIIELLGSALEKILGDRPQLPDRAAHALRDAFNRLTGGDRVTLRCHPSDLTFIQELLAKKLEEFAGFRQIRVIADEQVGVNGCLVETELGVVDARIEQQLVILKGILSTAAANATSAETRGESDTLEVGDGSPLE